MFNETIKLVKETFTTDEYGDRVATEEVNEVFAELGSISQSEFYNAQAIGLKPEIKFTIADYLDYHGETTLRYEPYDGSEETYRIIRTYRKNKTLELICKKGLE